MANINNNRVCAYTRFSTVNQTELSTEYQLDEIRKFCKDSGFEVVKVYSDEAKSGTTVKRDGFRQMLEDAGKSPEWSRIVIYDNSRFTRDFEDAVEYRRIFKRLGIDIFSVKDNNEDSPEANMSRNISNAANQYQVEKTRQHTISAMKTKAAKAEHNGGRPPLGYTVKDKKLVIIEEEAKIVELIFELYDYGYSYTEIINELSERGYTTINGTPFKKTSFNSILTNEKYIGRYVWNMTESQDIDKKRNSHAHKPVEEQIIVENGCPPIVDKERFDRVQQRMKSNKIQNKSGHGKHHYMLGGMKKIYCGECGALMTGASIKSHGINYLYYVCPNHKSKTDRCPTKNIRADRLDKYIVERIVRIVMSLKVENRDKFMNYYNCRLTRILKDRKRETELKNDIFGLDKKIANLTTSLETSYNEFIDNRLKKCIAEKKEKEAELDAITNIDIQMTEHMYKSYRKKLIDRLTSKKNLEVTRFLDQVVDKVTVTNDIVDIDIEI